ncbi:hypothetical protein ZWY2020_011332 [Hordeum vulgare]|nr:hypothetical protein ZWY2020_011332 [Hordeum vulgare]
MSSQSCGCAYPYQGVMYFRAPLFADVGNGTARRGGDVLLLPALPVSVPSFDPRHLQKRHGRTAATPAPSFRARRRQQKRPADAPGRLPALQPCTTCSRYVHVFCHPCLVCGRAYCRHCVGAGMGDMTEGRKCLDCLGRK